MNRRSAIIDMHCHTAGIGAGGSGCFVSARMRRSWRYRIYLKAFGVTEQDLVKAGDELIVQRLSELLGQSKRVAAAVVLALDGVIGSDGRIDRNASELYLPNRFVATAVARHPNLLFGASVNPCRRDALDRMDAAVAAGAVLMKWLPSIQGIDPADRRWIPFYRRLAEHGLPLLSHTGTECSFTRTQDELGDPERLRLPLEEGVTVIAAHAATTGANGGEGNFARFLRLAGTFPNLYADISALTQGNRPGHLARLLRHEELTGRLLYGTDMPLLTTGITSPLFQLGRLPAQQITRVMVVTNPWDRDVALKEALGVPAEVFTAAGRLLYPAHTVASLEGASS